MELVLANWWVGLGPCITVYMAQSALGWCPLAGGVGKLLVLIRLEGGFQNGSCQYQCYCCRTSFPNWLLPASPSSGGVPGVSSLWEGLQDEQMGLTEAPFKLLPLHQDSEHAKFCAHPSRAVFVSCSFLALLNISLTGFQSHMSWGLVFMVKDP